MKVVFTIASLMVLIHSCTERPEQFVIQGRIDGIADGSVITLYDIDQQVTIDSALTKNQAFVLKGKVDHPTLCWLRNGNEYAIVSVENVAMTFESPQEGMLFNSEVKGGPEQDLLNELQEMQRPYNLSYSRASDSLMAEKYVDEIDKNRLIARYIKNQQAAQAIYVDFGLRHPNSYLGLDIIYRNRKNIPRDSILAIYENLYTSYKDEAAAEAIRSFLFERIVQLGEPCITFQATTIDGQPFDFAATQGKYVYLTFWSRGCGPCRMENKFISKNISRIPELLSVVSFSIDRHYKDWQNASLADGITWTNVSDFSGERGTVKTQYEVQAVPTSFLIDRSGIVIKRFSGFDPNTDIIEELVKIIQDHEESS